RNTSPPPRPAGSASRAMYFGAPAWMLMTLAALSKLFVADPGGMDLEIGVVMFFVMFSVSLVPKLCGILDVALTRGGAAAYGGRRRFALSALAETVFSILMAPVVAMQVTIFLVGLMFGKRVVWGGQQREVHGLGWGEALAALWPQTLLGLAMLTAILVMAGPGLLVWAAPMVAGLSLAVPFAVLTAAPAAGAWARRVGLAAIPEERAPCASLARVQGGERDAPLAAAA
ncbi:MAG: glucans biosynthesis glucosyltransferase MdoH, partial [Pseudomonadota bacterium]